MAESVYEDFSGNIDEYQNLYEKGANDVLDEIEKVLFKLEKNNYTVFAFGEIRSKINELRG